MKFFIAQVLTGDAGEKADSLRHEISERFNVHGALLLPPHVTFVTPFEHMNADAVAEALRVAIEPFLPFTIPTLGFGAFRKDVWYIELEQSKKLFDVKNAIQAELGPRTGWLPGIYDKNTHFHLTIAYKDLTPDIHDAVGVFLKDKPVPIESVTVDAMTILLHEGKRWDEFQTVTFPDKK